MPGVSSKQSPDEKEKPVYFFLLSVSLTLLLGGCDFLEMLKPESFKIIQKIPSSNVEYPYKMPVIIYMNDKVSESSLEGNIAMYVNGDEVKSGISVNESANGFTILVVTAVNEIPDNADVKVIFSKGIKNKDGDELSEEEIVGYTAKKKTQDDFSGNKDFESGESGVCFIGDGAVISGTHGDVSPYSGSKMAAITTGGESLFDTYGIVSDHDAVDSTSSLMMLGPVSSTVSGLTFKYDFISSEFQEYIGSDFDDTAMITVVGPEGSVSVFITSVNSIGKDNDRCEGFYSMPDNGDNYAGHTGWVSFDLSDELAGVNIGSPVYIIFSVTDVADKEYSSALIIDNLQF